MYYDPYGAYETPDERAERQRREDERAARLAPWSDDDGPSVTEALALRREDRLAQRRRQAAADARDRARWERQAKATTTTTGEA